MEPYLSLNGNAAEAAAYYAKVFETPEPYVMRYGEMPPEEGGELPKGMEQLVMHANVKTYGGDIMMSDMMPDSSVTPNEGVWISFSHPDVDKLKETFRRLGRDGEVLMPLEKTFFSPLYGQLKDKFGFYWMIMSSEEP